MGRRALWLLPQAGRGKDGGVLQDLHDFLQLLCDVVLQQARCHHGSPRACVAIKQGPVVAGDALGLLGKEGDRKEVRTWVAPCLTTLILSISVYLKIMGSNMVKRHRDGP